MKYESNPTNQLIAKPPYRGARVYPKTIITLCFELEKKYGWTDGLTGQPTNQPTNGCTNLLIVMRGRI